MDNITVRHSEAGDIVAIRDLYAQPSCMASTLQTPYPSLELWQARLGRMHEHFHSLVACKNDRIFGQIGIELFTAARRKHVANIGMAVDESTREQGIGGKLLEAAIDLCHGWLAVTRIELETYVDNAAAIALFQKHGFRIEGTGIEYAFRAGHRVDVHFMARLAGTWASLTTP